MSATRTLLLAVVIAATVALAACSEQGEAGRVRITACAVADSSGEVRTVSCKDDPHRESLLDQVIALNARLPAPELPALESRQRAIGMDASGNLLLVDGARIALAGLRCDENMTDYLKAVFLDDFPAQLIYQPTGHADRGVPYAYVWEYSEFEVDEEFAAAFGEEKSYSLNMSNEAGIMSGWCAPVEQPLHKFHERFSALHALADDTD